MFLIPADAAFAAAAVANSPLDGQIANRAKSTPKFEKPKTKKNSCFIYITVENNKQNRNLNLKITVDDKPNRLGWAVLERPSSQMSYLDHFLKESGGGSSSTTHTNSTLAVNMVRFWVKLG